MRIQFLDVKTTLDRWKEEEVLVRVEMMRTADYFAWMAGFWGHCATHGVSQGSRAHASSMRLVFVNLEQKVRSKLV